MFSFSPIWFASHLLLQSAKLLVHLGAHPADFFHRFGATARVHPLAGLSYDRHHTLLIGAASVLLIIARLLGEHPEHRSDSEHIS